MPKINYIYKNQDGEYFKSVEKDGHIELSKKRTEEIWHALFMFGNDIWGTSAFRNLEIMDELRKELVSCVRCGKQIKKIRA